MVNENIFPFFFLYTDVNEKRISIAQKNRNQWNINSECRQMYLILMHQLETLVSLAMYISAAISEDFFSFNLFQV